jgi:hypothetical protein
MDAGLYIQLSWALAGIGWSVAFLCFRKAYSLWRINGELAHRYHVLKDAYDKLVEQHDAWCIDEKTDPNGISFISFDDLQLR